MAIVVPPEFDLRARALADPITRALPLKARAGGFGLPPDMDYVFIVFTNRSGSYYLAELLSTSGFFNLADEDLFSDRVLERCRQAGMAGYGDYFSEVAIQYARNNTYVVKSTIGELATLAWHGVLQQVLTRSRFVVIERMDKLGQAISWVIASQTGRYRSTDPAPTVAPVYDRAGIANGVARFAFENAQADCFFGMNGIVALHLAYERLIARPRITAQTVCEFLGHPELVCDPSRCRLRRQAGPLNAAWRARFLAEQARG